MLGSRGAVQPARLGAPLHIGGDTQPTMLALRRRSAQWLSQVGPVAARTATGSSGRSPAATRQVSTGTAAQAAAAEPPAAAAAAAEPAAAPARRSRPRGGKSASAAFIAKDNADVSVALAAQAAGIAKAVVTPRAGRPRNPAAAEKAAKPSGVDTVLLVESPAKAKKIQEFLGPDFKVLASYGHVRDLPAKPGSVDPSAGFAMSWQLSKDAEARMAQISGAVRGSRRLVLATDPDREGEAISWHLLQELKARNAVTDSTVTQRITFTEVTKSAVLDALEQPRQVSEPLVHAYLARRALDYLYGFNLSPMLWRKVPGARSAGRVQSVALRLVCEREAEVEAFQPLRYFKVGARLALPGGAALEARLASVDGSPPPQPGFLEQGAADAVVQRISAATWSVAEASAREQQRQPQAPFTTSTLQQAAGTRLGLGASRTMQLAQQLYEAGHITYMRTDGVSLAPSAVTQLRQAIKAEFGREYVPPKPRVYKARSKNAQEAHEAIRPTDPALTAEQLISQGVERSAAKLYGMIRGRTLACQMAPARISQVAAELGSADGTLRLRTSASTVAFPGFLAAYFDPSALSAAGGAASSVEEQRRQEEAEEGAVGAEETEEAGAGAEELQGRQQEEAARVAAAAALAALQHGQVVQVRGAAATEHETRPPPRYTEGTLVKRLEELGIGRPSTYAPILNVLQQRGYVRKEGRALHAQALGRVLTAFLQAHFPTYIDYEFTSGVEQQLDAVSGGEAEWQQVLDAFWTPFNQTLQNTTGVSVEQVINELNDAVGDQLIGTDRRCPSCGSTLSLKFSGKHRGAPFVGCSSYPDCTYLRPIATPWAMEVLPATGDAEKDEAAAGGEDLSALIPANMKGHTRVLGRDPDTKQPVFVRAGLYGPYVQRGVEGEPHFRRQALARNSNNRAVSLESALAMLALPKELGANPATGETIYVANGKFGPFLRSGVLSRAIPKEYDPITMSLADALQLLATKSRWNTNKKDRQAIGESVTGNGARAAAQAAAQEAAHTAAAAAQGQPAAASQFAWVEENRGRRPREQVASSAADAGLQSDTAEELDVVRRGWIGAAAAAEVEQGPPQEGRDARQLAAEAASEARLALDAAAEMEVDRLHKLMGIAKKQAPKRRPGPSGYNLFCKEQLETAARTGVVPLWRPVASTRTFAAQWKGMELIDKQKYEVLAAAKRRETELREAGLLGRDEQLDQLSEERMHALRADMAKHDLEQTVQNMVMTPGAFIKRPRSAFNIFCTVHMAAVKEEEAAGALGGTLLRLSEMWREASQQERHEFKLMAERERKKYHSLKAAIQRRRQAATSAALEEGQEPLSAARAGLEAAAQMLKDMLAQGKLGSTDLTSSAEVALGDQPEVQPPRRTRKARSKGVAAAAAEAGGGGG